MGEAEIIKSGNQITLAHGSGGRLMHNLIRELFVKRFSNKFLDRMSDSAVLANPLNDEYDLCFTTDSYVVDPLFFPGGNIGSLAVCGTINDMAVEGATPLFLSCGFIIEEGLDIHILEEIADAMAKTAREAGVNIVTGDLKVVEKGHADKVFINTSGVGRRPKRLKLGVEFIRAGDKVLINGAFGEHGIAVLSARGNFELNMDIHSDCAPLHGIIAEILSASDGIHFMRDPTRGGIATTLNEIVAGTSSGITIDEASLPLKEETRAACEILGFDPLYLANEGKVIIVASESGAEKILDIMRRNPLGKDSRIIGKVTPEHAGKVVMKTLLGGHRIIDMLTGEQLPRIC